MKTQWWNQKIDPNYCASIKLPLTNVITLLQKPATQYVPSLIFVDVTDLVNSSKGITQQIVTCTNWVK